MNRPRTLVPLLLLLAVALAACSNDQPPPTAPAATGSPAPTGQELARHLGAAGFACTGWTPNHDVAIARDSGSCRHGGQPITITTYTTAAQQTAARTAIDASGLVTGFLVTGDRFLISGVHARADADRIASTLGGTVTDH